MTDKIKTFDIKINTPMPVEIPPSWKTWDFVGARWWNKKCSYRSHAETLEFAVNDIITSYRIGRDDFKLVKVF